VVSPRIYDKRTDRHVACDTGGGPFARQWVTAKAGLVNMPYLKATGESIQMLLPKSANMPEMELEWKVPPWSNAVERDRARSYHQAYGALVALPLPGEGAGRGAGGPHPQLGAVHGPEERSRWLPRGRAGGVTCVPDHHVSGRSPRAGLVEANAIASTAP